ncbi:DUF4192 domain-containing protein [Georgenia muralis]
MDRIQANTPAEILAAIRYRLGFTPAESVVVAGITEDDTLGLIARVDVDATTSPGALAPVVRALTDARVAALILVAYTTGQIGARAALDLATVNNPDLLAWPTRRIWASPTHYGTLDTAKAPVRPIDDLDSTAVAAAMTAEGLAPAASRADLARAFDPAPTAARRAAATARDEWITTHTGNITDAVAATFDAWHAARTAPRPAAHGHLAAALTNKAARDAVLALILTGRRPTGPADIVAALDAHPAGRTDAVRAALDTLTATAAHNSGPYAAGPLALAAFIQWWLGNGAIANVYTDAALTEDPTHHLATLTRQALDAGVPPTWAQRP